MGHGGRTYDIVIKANPDDLNKQPDQIESEEDSPETLAYYFNQTSSLKDGFFDAILGFDQTGAATIPEYRAAEIAKAVLDGKLRPEDIAVEAAKGPTGRLAQEIVKKTETYLANGEYQGLKLFAVQMAGAASGGGGLALGKAVKEGIKNRLKSKSVGGFSKVLKSVQDILMKPMLEGGETGAINISLPSFKKVKVDWDHIFSGHKIGGSRVATDSGKTLFPEHMSDAAIKRAVETAFRNSKRIGTQGDKIILLGKGEGLAIRMYYNKVDKKIETAFPIFNKPK